MPVWFHTVVKPSSTIRLNRKGPENDDDTI
jgi:hypothetical protein